MKRIYLDNNATTQVDEQVLEAMRPWQAEMYGNPSSLHFMGDEARTAVERARATLAGLIGARPEEIIFTASGTEGNNLCINGVVEACALGNFPSPWPGGGWEGVGLQEEHQPQSHPPCQTYPFPLGKKEDSSSSKIAEAPARHYKDRGHIITSAIEHPSVLETCRALEKLSFEVTYLPVDTEGFVSPADLETALQPDTILVSIMHANNEIGTIQPLAELSAVIRRFRKEKQGAVSPTPYALRPTPFFHSDLVQSFTKLPCHVDDLGLDLATFSAHKFHGPKGAGFIYKRKGVALTPQTHGGSHEQNLRAGTLNVPGIVGMATAAEINAFGLAPSPARGEGWGGVGEVGLSREELPSHHLRELQEYLLRELLTIPSSHLNGPADLARRLPNNINVSFAGIEGEHLLLALSAHGICVSTGSACSATSSEISPVLRAISCPPEYIESNIRVSTSKHTTLDELNTFLSVFRNILALQRHN